MTPYDLVGKNIMCVKKHFVKQNNFKKICFLGLRLCGQKLRSSLWSGIRRRFFDVNDAVAFRVEHFISFLHHSLLTMHYIFNQNFSLLPFFISFILHYAFRFFLILLFCVSPFYMPFLSFSPTRLLNRIFHVLLILLYFTTYPVLPIPWPIRY
jgi:hypothetical protein